MYSPRYNRQKIYVLRIGHRPDRDKRITTHVALVARAFGAHGFILAGVVDDKVMVSIRKVLHNWGGSLFIAQGIDPLKYIKIWRKLRGLIVHLTMYGICIDKVIDEIRNSGRDILVIVGAEKVPRYIYEEADYNIAIGNQPHSEVAALAIFLDRYYMGRELYFTYEGARIVIVPSPKGKKVKIVGKR